LVRFHECICATRHTYLSRKNNEKVSERLI
jgi:hypothetical protein